MNPIEAEIRETRRVPPRLREADIEFHFEKEIPWFDLRTQTYVSEEEALKLFNTRLKPVRCTSRSARKAVQKLTDPRRW